MKRRLIAIIVISMLFFTQMVYAGTVSPAMFFYNSGVGATFNSNLGGIYKISDDSDSIRLRFSSEDSNVLSFLLMDKNRSINFLNSYNMRNTIEDINKYWSTYLSLNEGMNNFTLYEIDEDTQNYGINEHTQSYPVGIYRTYDYSKYEVPLITIPQIPRFKYIRTENYSSLTSYIDINNSISSIDMLITASDAGSEVKLNDEIIISQGTIAGTVITKNIPLSEGPNNFEIESTYELWSQIVYRPIMNKTFTIYRNYASNNNPDNTGSGGNGGGSGGSGTETPPVDTTVDPATNTVVVSVSQTQLAALFAMLEDKEDEVKLAVINIPKVTGLNKYGIQLPVSAFTASNGKGVRLETEIGSLTLMDTMLQNVVNATDVQNVKFNMEYVNKTNLDQTIQDTIGNHPIISLNMELDGTTTAWNNPDSPVIVSVPYEPTPEELANPELIVVYYIDGEGNLNAIPNATYDAVNKCMVFTTTHFSDYALGFSNKAFSDITDDVVNHAATVLAAKGVLNGKTGNEFKPNDTVTRAEFITMLSRAFEFNKPFTNTFIDLEPGKYYYKPIGMAKEMGIVNGVGNNLFSPDAVLNKNQIEIIVDNLIKAGELSIDEVKLTAIMSGIDKATRGECAVLIYGLM
jgi:hypothetical protein